MNDAGGVDDREPIAVALGFGGFEHRLPLLTRFGGAAQTFVLHRDLRSTASIAPIVRSRCAPRIKNYSFARWRAASIAFW